MLSAGSLGRIRRGALPFEYGADSGVQKAVTIRFRCDACGGEVSASEDRVGDLCRCPGCGKVVIVPRQGAVPPE